MWLHGLRRRADEEQESRLAQAVLLLLGVPEVPGLDQPERRTRWQHILQILLRQILRTQGCGLRHRSWHPDNGLILRPKKRAQGLIPVSKSSKLLIGFCQSLSAHIFEAYDKGWYCTSPGNSNPNSSSKDKIRLKKIILEMQLVVTSMIVVCIFESKNRNSILSCDWNYMLWMAKTNPSHNPFELLFKDIYGDENSVCMFRTKRSINEILERPFNLVLLFLFIYIYLTVGQIIDRGSKRYICRDCCDCLKYVNDYRKST